MIIWTLPKQVSDLQRGDVVITHGQARYLLYREATLMGYDSWRTARVDAGECATQGHSPSDHHELPADCLIYGTANFRQGCEVPVLCVTLDGAVLAEVTP